MVIENFLQKFPIPLLLSEGLWHKGDGKHFDSPSATELGRRYAETMLELQNKQKNDKKSNKMKMVANLLK